MMFALFTDIPMNEVDEMLAKDIIDAKKKLCYEITKFVRGKDDADKAVEATNSLFGNGDNLADAPTFTISKGSLGKNVVDICVEAKLVSSKGEAKRLIMQNGINLNDEKVELNTTLKQEDFAKGYALLKKGKKSYIKLEIK